MCVVFFVERCGVFFSFCQCHNNTTTTTTTTTTTICSFFYGFVSLFPSRPVFRMYSKMYSPDDHRYDASPRPASNIDIVRVLAAVDTPKDLHEAISRVVSQLAPVSRVKNGFASSTEEAKKNFYLRVVLINVMFTSDKTYQDLVSDVNVAKTWHEYLHDSHADGQPGGRWRKDINTALSWLRNAGQSTLANQSVRMICEVQFTLGVGVGVRGLMHGKTIIMR